MGGKLQLLSGEVCRVRWENPGNPSRRGPAEPAEVSRGHSTRRSATTRKGRTQKRGFILVRSRGERRRQPSWKQPSLWEVAVKPQGPKGEPSVASGTSQR